MGIIVVDARYLKKLTDGLPVLIDMPRTIGIVIPVFKYFEGVADLLYSVKTKHNYRVIIMPQYMSQLPLAKAWNDGAKEAFNQGCDYALVCNDDILFAPECLDNMVEQYEKLRPSENVIMVTPNNILAQLTNKYDILGYTTPDDPFTWADHPNFSCFLISPEYFEKVGYFDENFVPAWFEDNDAHYRAHLLGYKLATTTAAPMVHIGAVSSNLAGAPNSEASRSYFFKKWGSIKRDLDETFKTPYNDPNLTPKDWTPNYV
jgi:hypothetical protein